MKTLIRMITVALTVYAGLNAGVVSYAADFPSADQVIGKYLEAAGDAPGTAKFKNRVTKATFTLPDMGMVAPMETYLAPPNMYTEISLEAFGLVQRGVVDGVAWEMNPMQGNRVLDGTAKEEMINQAASFNSLANWKERYDSAEVVAEEDVEGVAAYKLDLKSGERTQSAFFSKETGLLINLRNQTPEGFNISTKMDDYKEVDGVKIPHKISSSGGPFNLEITVESVQHDAEIPGDKFALPAAIKQILEGPPAQAPAPAGEAEQSSEN